MVKCVEHTNKELQTKQRKSFVSSTNSCTESLQQENMWPSYQDNMSKLNQQNKSKKRTVVAEDRTRNPRCVPQLPIAVTSKGRPPKCGRGKIASTSVTLHLPVADEQIFVRDFEAISEDGSQESVQKQVLKNLREKWQHS